MSTPLSRYLTMLPRNLTGGGMAPQSAIIWDAFLMSELMLEFQIGTLKININ